MKRAAAASEKASIEAVGRDAFDAGNVDEAQATSVLYVRFRAAVPELHTLMAEVESRSGSPEYQKLLSDTQALYCEARLNLVQRMAERKVNAFKTKADGSPNRDAVIDYAHRAVHLMTVVAKQVIRAYYGEPPRYSYYEGCSTGGRMGLVEVQRYPHDYDGVVVCLGDMLHQAFGFNDAFLGQGVARLGYLDLRRHRRCALPEYG